MYWWFRFFDITNRLDTCTYPNAGKKFGDDIFFRHDHFIQITFKIKLSNSIIFTYIYINLSKQKKEGFFDRYLTEKTYRLDLPEKPK